MYKASAKRARDRMRMESEQTRMLVYVMDKTQEKERKTEKAYLQR